MTSKDYLNPFKVTSLTNKHKNILPDNILCARPRPSEMIRIYSLYEDIPIDWLLNGAPTHDGH